MSYVDDKLEIGETVTYQAAVSRVALANGLAVAILVMCIMLYPAGSGNLWGTELVMTNRRLLGKTGLFKQQYVALPFKRLERIKVSQGVLGHLFGYGTVTVVGDDGRRVKFKGIKFPLELQYLANEAIEEAILGRKLSQVDAPSKPSQAQTPEKLPPAAAAPVKDPEGDVPVKPPQATTPSVEQQVKDAYRAGVRKVPEGW